MCDMLFVRNASYDGEGEGGGTKFSVLLTTYEIALRPSVRFSLHMRGEACFACFHV